MEKILEVDKTFYEKLKGIVDSVEKLNRFKDYYEWLNDLEVEDEEMDTLLQVKGKLIDKVVTMVNNDNLHLKELTNRWNGSLVRRVVDYCVSIENCNRSMSPIPSNEKIASVYKAVVNESDFVTKVYCWKLLRDRAGIPFKDFGMEKKEENCGEPIEGKTMRPAYNETGYIADYGIQYWHTKEKQLMTYDECAEKGYGRHLLSYPPGHPLQGLYVGFAELDPSRVMRSEDYDEETKNFFNDIFVNAETL